MGMQRWLLPAIEPQKQQEISSITQLPALVCKVLAGRFAQPEQVVAFLSPNLPMQDPFSLIDMSLAVERIHQAVENQEKIAVFGDYDCDGVTSTALLTIYLQSIGADVFYYIPDRAKEGYGMSCSAMDNLKKMGAQLIITVDNGISAHQEVAYAQTLNMDVIVTDHHTPRPTLPPALAVINPHRTDCPSSFKDLAGVGVTFALVCGLEDAPPEEMLEHYSDYVTIGTVADVVPLTGDNRTIVRHGLELLRESSHPGILTLLNQAGIDLEKPLSTQAASFGIAPRINAAGRIGSADDAVELLVTDDPRYAAEMADILAQANQQRRDMEETILMQAIQILNENPTLSQRRVLVVCGENWHHGVTGIVASRLMERYGKPCLVCSLEQGEIRCSGRSIPGFNLVQAITACEEWLVRFGGHPLAAGLTLKEENFSSFQNALQDYSAQYYPIMPLPSLMIDTIVEPQELTLSSIGAMQALAPFGAENPAPMYLAKNASIQGIFPTKDRNHMRVKLKLGTQEFNAIWFRMSEEKFPYILGDQVDFVCCAQLDEWNGSPTLSIQIKDMRLADYPEQEHIDSFEIYQRWKEKSDFGDATSLIPSREESAVVYRFLKSRESYPYSLESLSQRLPSIPMGKLLTILDVFVEQGLISQNSSSISILPTTKKVDLNQSQLLKGLQSCQTIPTL